MHLFAGSKSDTVLSSGLENILFCIYIPEVFWNFKID